MHLDYYHYFYYVCEFKSITKAAKFLYVSQPAITKQIHNLENHLGKKLIIRSTTGIELTEDGELLYQEIKNSIETLNNVEASFMEKSDQYHQTIRIIAGQSTLKKFLLKSLFEFNQTHPTIKFEINTSFYPESIQLLKEGKADLVFLTLEDVNQTYHNIVFEKYMEVEDIFVVHKSIKNQFPEKILLKDLNQYPIICLSNNMLSRKWIDSYFEKQNLVFKPKYEIFSTWLIEEYVSLKAGIGLLVKQHIEEQLNSGEFVELKTDISLPKRTMGYAYRKGSLNYSVIKELISYLQK